MAKKKMGGLGKGLDSLFADLSDDMKLAEDMIKFIIAYVQRSVQLNAAAAGNRA